MRQRRYRPSLDRLPSRLSPSGDLAGAAVAVAPTGDAATIAAPAPDVAPSDAPAAAPDPQWSGPMMPSDDDLDLTPWTLAEMVPPADPPF